MSYLLCVLDICHVYPNDSYDDTEAVVAGDVLYPLIFLVRPALRRSRADFLAPIYTNVRGTASRRRDVGCTIVLSCSNLRRSSPAL